jgi:hypothetical protein
MLADAGTRASQRQPSRFPAIVKKFNSASLVFSTQTLMFHNRAAVLACVMQEPASVDLGPLSKRQLEGLLRADICSYRTVKTFRVLRNGRRRIKSKRLG